MNETTGTLLKRRSVRTYKPEQLRDGDLQLILEAGRFAPSGMNCQPWHFTVVQNKDMLKKINEFVRAGILKTDIANQAMKERAKSEDFSAFYNAPTLIIVSGDKNAVTPIYDCTLAMGNMFNAAASIGVGSCWIHAIAVGLSTEVGKDLAGELGIPEGYTAFCSGAFGYNAGEAPSPAPRKEGNVTIVR